MIGQMAIALALPGFNARGRSVNPTFLSRNSFYKQLAPHCPKTEQLNQYYEAKKKSTVLSTRHRFLPSHGRKARETMVGIVKVTSHLRECPSEKNSYARWFQ